MTDQETDLRVASRRRFLRWGGVGAAAAVASVVAADRAGAATGDAVTVDGSFTGSSTTQISSSTTTGAAIHGVSSAGTGVPASSAAAPRAAVA